MHFSTFLRKVDEVYSPFFSGNERGLIDSYFSVSEPAQRLFVRLVNRKGPFFFLSELDYPEIPSLEEEARRLLTSGLLRHIRQIEYKESLLSTKKNRLSAILRLRESSEPFPKSLKKAELAESVAEQIPFLRFQDSPYFRDVLVLTYAAEWSFLCFLAFGDLESDLKLYALRDLGIRGGNGLVQDFRCRFKNESEARSEFFYRKLRSRARLNSPENLPIEFKSQESWPEADGPGAKQIREKLLLEIAELHLRAKDENAALALLAQGKSPRVAEKRLRLLFSLGKKEEVRNELDRILSAPDSEDLLFFAEDFSKRKFGVETTSAVTQALREARTVRLDAAFRGRPELGVRDFLGRQGLQVYWCENNLWLSLFGILLWSELFASPDSALHSEFDFLPTDLVRRTFYEKHRGRIHELVSALNSGSFSERELVERYNALSGRTNGIFRWHPELLAQLSGLLTASSRAGARIADPLLALSRDFEANKRGFPDLFTIDQDGFPKFIEVKSLGDRLQPVQLRQILSLSNSGYATEIVRVEWDYDPKQTYVVVDVETTGGTPLRHRLTEVAAIKFRGGEIVDELSNLINPERRIPKFITGLTGISNEMVKDAPKFHEIADSLSAFLEDSIFVAHNATFDVGFLSAEFRRLGRSFRMPTLCTRVEMRRAYPGLDSYSLKDLTRSFGISLTEHHRARSDALAALELLKLVLQKN